MFSISILFDSFVVLSVTVLKFKHNTFIGRFGSVAGTYVF